MCPESFSDGECAQWIRCFEMCSDANKWDGATKFVRPPTLLQGLAFSVFERLDLSEDDRKSYSALKAALLNVFEPNTEERRRHALRQLQQRQLGKSEDAGTYVYQLERPLDRSCPGLDKEVRDLGLLDRFIDGLPNEIREKLPLVPAMDLRTIVNRTRELLLFDRSHRCSLDIGQGSVESPDTGMSHLPATPVPAMQPAVDVPLAPNLERLLTGRTNQLQSLQTAVMKLNHEWRSEREPTRRSS